VSSSSLPECYYNNNCRFPSIGADHAFIYLRLCRILTKMADAFFSSSWRIL
jgi:hypothetical protein